MILYKCRDKTEGSEYYQVTDKEKKQMVQCRDCEAVFNQSELITLHKKVYDIDIKEKVCPECGGTCGLMNYPWDEEFLIYKSKKFFNRKCDKRRINLWYDYYDKVDYDDWEGY